jgi:type VI secretion system protein ImpF
MARVDPNQGLIPSILDRLIDPEGAAGTAWRRGYGFDQLEAAVRRDLEDLLNTRQTYQRLPAEFAKLQESILVYGMPDLTSLNSLTPENQQQMTTLLETAIQRFEPRLREVMAKPSGAGDGKDRTSRFRIEAMLGINPVTRVAFETVQELATNHCVVNSMDTPDD